MDLKIYIDLGLTKIPLNVWTIRHEKEYLLIDKENASIDQLVDIAFGTLLNLNPIEYNINEKLLLLISARKFANGEQVELQKCECKQCKHITGRFFNIENSIRFKQRNLIEFIIDDKCFVFKKTGSDIITSLDYIKINDIIIQDVENYVDNMEIIDYDKLEKYYEKNSGYFYLEGSIQCDLCGYQEPAKITNPKNILNWLTSTDLKTYYKNAMHLNYFGKINISEYENMLPFEVDIYIGQLTEIMKSEQQV